jgi:hypothetical protein
MRHAAFSCRTPAVQSIENAFPWFGPAGAFSSVMTVAAPRTFATGIEAAFAAATNAPAPKSFSSVPPSAMQAVLFPDLLGEIVDCETVNQPSFPRGTAPGSKATTGLTARASGKPAGEKNRTVSARATSTTTSEPDQNPVLPDPASARTNYPWPPQDGALSLAAASPGPFFQTSDTGSDGAADKASVALVGADGEAPSGQVHATRAAAKPGQAPPDTASPCARSRQPSNPVTEAAGGLVIQSPALAFGAGSSAGAAAQQALELPATQAAAATVPSASESSGDRAKCREPAAIASGNRAPASSPSTAVTLPDDRMAGVARRPAGPPQTMAEQAGRPVVADGADGAASLFARLAAPDGDHTFEPDRAASDPSDANAAGGGGSSDGDSPVEQGTLAFQAWLVPAPASDPQRAGQAPREKGGDSSGQQPAQEGSGGLAGSRSGFRSTRDGDPGPDGGAPPVEPVAHSLFPIAPVPSNAGVSAAAPQGMNPPRAASPAPSNLSAGDASGPEPRPTAGGAAREIQLELRDADARVNLRLVERAGSVQVDVRTPDSHLAGSLRDDLPALTARLEQTGLRAETWHDAPAAAAARIRMAETTSSAGFQASQNQSRREGGGRDPRDGQPQEKRQNQNQPKPKEFSWLYTSLQ